jgi:hypothetical protein
MSPVVKRAIVMTGADIVVGANEYKDGKVLLPALLFFSDSMSLVSVMLG